METKSIICKHCGECIKHFKGRIWHSYNQTVFPQYCRTDKGGELHEPVWHEPVVKEVTSNG